MNDRCLSRIDRLAFDSLIDDLKQPDLGYEIDVDGKDRLIKLPEKVVFDWDEHSIDQIRSSLVTPARFIKFVLYLESNELKQSDRALLEAILNKTAESLIDEANKNIEEVFLSKDLMRDSFTDGLSVTADLYGAFTWCVGSDEDYFTGLERIAKRSGVFDDSFFDFVEDDTIPELFEYAPKQSLIDRFVKIIEDHSDEYLIKGIKKDNVDWFTQTELIIEQNVEL